MTATTTAPNPQVAINLILEFLGEPQNGWQKQALADFEKGDTEAVRLTYTQNATDAFCRAMNFLVAAKKPSPGLMSILAAAERAAAEYYQQRTYKKLGEQIHDALVSAFPFPNGVKVILDSLTPETELHRTLAIDFANGEYAKIREAACKHADDPFCEAIAYLCAVKEGPTLPVNLMEAAEPASKHLAKLKLRELGSAVVASFQ